MSNSGSINIKELSVSFGKNKIFDNVNAQIKYGQKVLITGSSGCGKSTFLKCLLGFVPAGGSIYFGEQKLCSTTVWQLRNRIAYVPQEPLFHGPIVTDVLKEPFSYKANQHLRYNEARVDELLEYFILNRAIKKANTEDLSGGEKQRIAIIAAILLDRQFMLFDEPTSALDPQSREAFYNLMTERSDITALIVSHDQHISSLVDDKINIAAAAKEIQR